MIISNIFNWQTNNPQHHVSRHTFLPDCYAFTCVRSSSTLPISHCVVMFTEALGVICFLHHTHIVSHITWYHHWVLFFPPIQQWKNEIEKYSKLIRGNFATPCHRICAGNQFYEYQVFLFGFHKYCNSNWENIFLCRQLTVNQHGNWEAEAREKKVWGRWRWQAKKKNWKVAEKWNEYLRRMHHLRCGGRNRERWKNKHFHIILKLKVCRNFSASQRSTFFFLIFVVVSLSNFISDRKNFVYLSLSKSFNMNV